jgi:FkbM family methyltransferase
MAPTSRSLPDGRTVLGVDRGETDYLYKEIFEDRTYIAPGAAPLPPAPVVFDVGANIGMFSLFALTEWPGARVFAFEPVPDVFALLKRNVGAEPGATVHRLALGSAPEDREISYYPHYTMMSGFDADPVADRETVAHYVRNTAEEIEIPAMKAAVLENMDRMLDGRFEQQRIPVRVETVTEMVARHGLDRVDLLKVDVEGFELEVLRGVSDELWPRVGRAVVEVEDRQGRLAQVEALLRKHGMDTEVRQVHEYRGSDLYILFAERPGLAES